MNKSKFIISIFIISLALVGAGCFGGQENGLEENGLDGKNGEKVEKSDSAATTKYAKRYVRAFWNNLNK